MTASGFAAAKRQKKLAPGAHLDIARGVQLVADGAGKVDIETDEGAVLVVEVEGWEVGLGKKAHDDAL